MVKIKSYKRLKCLILCKNNCKSVFKNKKYKL